MKDIRIIAFDADDTLWINEPYFRDAERKFCTLFSDVISSEEVSEELLKTEKRNMPLYGYGIKAFTLSMIETAVRIAPGTLDPAVIGEIIGFSKELIHKPVLLLKGVEEVLRSLSHRYKLIVATKGDLLDQERKLEKSGLSSYFSHIEIMSDKKTKDYKKLLEYLDCPPSHFLMIGNSIKSDILPVLEIGGFAAHVPFSVTWAYEHVEENVEHPHLICLQTIGDIFNFLIQ